LEKLKIQQAKILILPLRCLKHRGIRVVCYTGAAIGHGGVKEILVEVLVAGRWAKSGLATVEETGAIAGPRGRRGRRKIGVLLFFFFLND